MVRECDNEYSTIQLRTIEFDTILVLEKSDCNHHFAHVAKISENRNIKRLTEKRRCTRRQFDRLCTIESLEKILEIFEKSVDKNKKLVL